MLPSFIPFYVKRIKFIAKINFPFKVCKLSTTYNFNLITTKMFNFASKIITEDYFLFYLQTKICAYYST